MRKNDFEEILRIRGLADFDGQSPIHPSMPCLSHVPRGSFKRNKVRLQHWRGRIKGGALGWGVRVNPGALIYGFLHIPTSRYSCP